MVPRSVGTCEECVAKSRNVKLHHISQNISQRASSFARRVRPFLRRSILPEREGYSRLPMQNKGVFFFFFQSGRARETSLPKTWKKKKFDIEHPHPFIGRVDPSKETTAVSLFRGKNTSNSKHFVPKIGLRS